jgi:hypothetical protein
VVGPAEGSGAENGGVHGEALGRCSRAAISCRRASSWSEEAVPVDFHVAEMLPIEYRW